MKFFLLLLPVLFLTACGTTAKVFTSGAVDLNRKERGEAVAPVLLVYRTFFSQHLHQIFFWDEFQNRFNLEVPANTDTSKGILVYLPAERSYALSGMLFLRGTHWKDVSFGTDLKMFHVKRGRTIQLTYFEILEAPKNGFFVRKTSPQTQEIYLTPVRANFQLSPELKIFHAL